MPLGRYSGDGSSTSTNSDLRRGGIARGRRRSTFTIVGLPAIPDTCATRYGRELSAIGSPANGVLELVAKNDDRSGACEAVKGCR